MHAKDLLALSVQNAAWNDQKSGTFWGIVIHNECCSLQHVSFKKMEPINGNIECQWHQRRVLNPDQSSLTGSWRKEEDWLYYRDASSKQESLTCKYKNFFLPIKFKIASRKVTAAFLRRQGWCSSIDYLPSKCVTTGACCAQMLHRARQFLFLHNSALGCRRIYMATHVQYHEISSLLAEFCRKWLFSDNWRTTF